MRDSKAQSDSDTCAWSEPGLQAFEWLRLGVAAQSTPADGGEREGQRGSFIQTSWGPVTLRGYGFDPRFR